MTQRAFEYYASLAFSTLMGVACGAVVIFVSDVHPLMAVLVASVWSASTALGFK